MDQRDHNGPEWSVPDAVDPMPAWRMWEVGPNGTLWSYNHDFEWELADNTAVCQAGEEHDAPDERCKCGIYALNSIFEMWRSLGNVVSHEYVYGRVGLHGRLIVGEKGYRAQYADVTGILIVPWQEETRWGYARRHGAILEQAVADHYDVPLLWDLCRDFMILKGGPLRGHVVPRGKGQAVRVRGPNGRVAIYRIKERPFKLPVKVTEYTADVPRDDRGLQLYAEGVFSGIALDVPVEEIETPL